MNMFDFKIKKCNNSFINSHVEIKFTYMKLKGRVSLLTVKSAKRVFKVFEILIDHPNGLTSNDISEKLGLPPSSTLNLLKTIKEKNYLIRDSNKKYKLGPKLIPLGTSAMESLDITEMSSRYLHKLMSQVEETVFLAILSSDEVVYVMKIDSYQSVRTTAQPGNKKPLYCTGLGKAFLAFMPEEKRNRILSQTNLKSFTNKTIVDKDILQEKLIQYRNLGYSIDEEENEEGLCCFAAPIFGAGGELIAAFSVAGPKERVGMKKDEIVKQVKNTSLAISKDMGYRNKGD